MHLNAVIKGKETIKNSKNGEYRDGILKASRQDGNDVVYVMQ